MLGQMRSDVVQYGSVLSDAVVRYRPDVPAQDTVLASRPLSK